MRHLCGLRTGCIRTILPLQHLHLHLLIWYGRKHSEGPALPLGNPMDGKHDDSLGDKYWMRQSQPQPERCLTHAGGPSTPASWSEDGDSDDSEEESHVEMETWLVMEYCNRGTLRVSQIVATYPVVLPLDLDYCWPTADSICESASLLPTAWLENTLIRN